MISAFTVFLLTLVLDALYAVCVRATAQGKAMTASVSAVLIYLTGAGVTISVVGDNWLVIPASLGGFVGTYMVVRWCHRSSLKAASSPCGEEGENSKHGQG